MLFKMRNLKPGSFLVFVFAYLCSGSETEASVSHAVNHLSLKETKLFPVSEQNHRQETCLKIFLFH